MSYSGSLTSTPRVKCHPIRSRFRIVVDILLVFLVGGDIIVTYLSRVLVHVIKLHHIIFIM
ncbi:MAG: DUF1622 domain-containing protein [Proteobacteria bacterium]|nr:DUF1622 domain-containing protein [Pseudomonadota bacterium]